MLQASFFLKQGTVGAGLEPAAENFSPLRGCGGLRSDPKDTAVVLHGQGTALPTRDPSAETWFLCSPNSQNLLLVPFARCRKIINVEGTSPSEPLHSKQVPLERPTLVSRSKLLSASFLPGLKAAGPKWGRFLPAVSDRQGPGPRKYNGQVQDAIFKPPLHPACAGVFSCRRGTVPTTTGSTRTWHSDFSVCWLRLSKSTFFGRAAPPKGHIKA